VSEATGRPELQAHPLSSLQDVREEWAALASRGANVFATWEWASVWWRHFGRRARLAAIALRDPGGELVGMAPLYERRVGGLRMLRFLGHDAGDELGPICVANDRERVGAALLGALERRRWQVLIGEQLPATAAWGALLGGRVLRREGSPVLSLRHESWDALLAQRSRNFREQVRRRERKLRREQGLVFRPGGLGDDAGRDLDTLFALHRASRPRASSFIRAEDFHREFAAVAFERGWGRLWILEAGGEPRAAWYGFRFNGVESYYQGGRDPAWDRYSVGFVLLAHSIRAAIEDGMSEYRLLRGGEPYKQRFADEDPGLETIALARGPVGRAALGAAGRLRHLRPLRRWRPRWR
jgi:CelD/BcsL family acetyltransferase involved in cellulose biosynthesis